MIPAKVPIKGPQGNLSAKDNGDERDLGDQEKYESQDEHKDLVGGEPTQDPTTLKAHDGDHTPNHTRAPKQAKVNYGVSHGRGDGGVGL
jgi:hypothetical protein